MLILFVQTVWLWFDRAGSHFDPTIAELWCLEVCDVTFSLLSPANFKSSEDENSNADISHVKQSKLFQLREKTVGSCHNKKLVGKNWLFEAFNTGYASTQCIFGILCDQVIVYVMKRSQNNYCFDFPCSISFSGSRRRMQTGVINMIHTSSEL